MPVFARATTPAGPYKNGPSRLGTPISFGGVPVMPGDITSATQTAHVHRNQAANVSRWRSRVADGTRRTVAIIANRRVRKIGKMKVAP